MKTMVKTATLMPCCENCYWCGGYYRGDKMESCLVCMKDDWWDTVYPVVDKDNCCEDWLDRDRAK